MEEDDFSAPIAYASPASFDGVNGIHYTSNFKNVFPSDLIQIYIFKILKWIKKVRLGMKM